MQLKDEIEYIIQNTPCSAGTLKKQLGTDAAGRRRVMEALDELVRSGRVCQRQGIFFTVRSGRADRVYPCTVVKLGKNFAFAQKEDKTGEFFIPGRDSLGAMPGDRVLVERNPEPRVAGSDEGAILAVLDEKNEFIGTIGSDYGEPVFLPDCSPETRLKLADGSSAAALMGDKVAAEITARGTHHDEHRITVLRNFGSSQQAKNCVAAMLYAERVSADFSEEVEREAAQLKDPGDDVSLAGRVDLRALPIFTIDSAQTKDMDDAINILQTAEGYELGVHIADVSHYVTAGSALDEEAFRRGTSIYYANRVIPMLPTQLSNGVCSLNEKETRLAFSCLMKLDKDGNLKSYRFVKSVIKSRVKGVYSELNEIIDGTATAEIRAKYAEVQPQLAPLRELYRLRSKLRANRGCLEMDSAECSLILNEAGECIDIRRHGRGECEMIIEEMMLLANQCAGHFARTKKLPFVYRVHTAPEGEKAENLKTLLENCGMGYLCTAGIPTQRALASALNTRKGTPEETILRKGLLKCMPKAVYEDKPKGHYGLVLADYAHFTSPIRRYADLMVHRILTDAVRKQPAEVIAERYTDAAARAAQQVTERELVSVRLERGAEDCYKAEYMGRFIGKTFTGVISGVVQRGLYVELENTAEGFIPASALTDSGTYYTENVSLSDPVSGKIWRIGDTVCVNVVKCDAARGKIDFSLVQSGN